MKRKIALLMGALFLVTSLAGCGGKQSETALTTAAGQGTTAAQNSGGAQGGETAESTAGLSGKTLKVGTMPVTLGVPVQYAYDMGYFEEAGLDVEIVLFATGAPVNEAMAAGEIDVAVSGMASVYALATTAHFMAIKYVESFGLTADDFTMMSMEYAQAYQAFIMGDGDLLATKPPYTSQLEAEGYVKVCSIADAMGSALVNAIYTQDAVFADRNEDLKVFLECYYRACEELNNDPDIRKEFSMTWYEENGITFSQEDMEDEMKSKIYHTLESVDSAEYPFGLTMLSIGEFFTEQGMIEQDNLPNIAKSMNDSLIKALK